MRRIVPVALLVAPSLLVPAMAGAQQDNPPLPPASIVKGLPLGDVPSGPREDPAVATKNPFEGHADAIQTGKQLFAQMNCAYCHGFDAGGLMGPGLTDKSWRYGGHPVEIFKSIAEGRPKGMPAWGKMLPPDEIWRVVAYIQSLGGALPADASGDQGDQPGGSGPKTAEHAPGQPDKAPQSTPAAQQP